MNGREGRKCKGSRQGSQTGQTENGRTKDEVGGFLPVFSSRSSGLLFHHVFIWNKCVWMSCTYCQLR